MFTTIEFAILRVVLLAFGCPCVIDYLLCCIDSLVPPWLFAFGYISLWVSCSPTLVFDTILSGKGRVRSILGPFVDECLLINFWLSKLPIIISFSQWISNLTLILVFHFDFLHESMRTLHLMVLYWSLACQVLCYSQLMFLKDFLLTILIHLFDFITYYTIVAPYLYFKSFFEGYRFPQIYSKLVTCLPLVFPLFWWCNNFYHKLASAYWRLEARLFLLHLKLACLAYSQ